jgi:hypothetical protein
MTLIFAPNSAAFQIGPLGSALEARLTNESESTRLRAAKRLGRRIKWPVHEEITQIAFDCPANFDDLARDTECAGSDLPYADAFVMHGIRWNDVPPFALTSGQGSRCRKFLTISTPACRTDQTVRFSTQPDCWLCLFDDAEEIAQSKRITGCQRGEGFVQGNLMTRSHFGDLQFLHAMADATGVPAEITHSKILDWVEFAWRVVTGEVKSEQMLAEIDLPTIKEHFGCSGWSVSDLYVLGAKPTLNRRISNIAFGSVVHTVQDSFASGHVQREIAPLDSSCPGSGLSVSPGAIVEFHAYGPQDGKKHDSADERRAMVEVANSAAGVVAVTRQLFELWNENATWSEAKPFFDCVFALSPNATPSSAGKDFER